MKSQDEIYKAIDELKDGHSLREGDEDWLQIQGWIEALEWVTGIAEKRMEQKIYKERISDIMLTDKERNDIIRRRIQDVHSEAISITDDADSETGCVCSCGKGQSSCSS